jgi:Na+/proline symporter
VTSNFTWLDALVLCVYLGGVTTLGMYLGRKQKNATDYFVASHTIPWWALMLSIVATETSALTFISTPGLAYGTAPGSGNLGFLQIVAGYILGRVVVATVLLPRYFQGKMVTAYALLEQRFGIGARRFTSIVFMVTRALADAVRVFATAIPIALIISPSVQNKGLVMPVAILILGALTVMYTYRGGMKAVVWTELLQASIYLLGAISAIVLLGHAVSGRMVIDHRSGERCGQIARRRHVLGSEPRAYDLGGTHRRRFSRHGVARDRSADRAATARGT